MKFANKLLQKSVFLIVAIILLFLIYPREVVLVPEIGLAVSREDGQVVTNGEVCRTYNHFLGDGWKSTILRTDNGGMVKFFTVTKRVPRILEWLKIVVAPFGHYSPGLAMSLKARDGENHYI